MVHVSVTSANICALPIRPQNAVVARIAEALSIDPAAAVIFQEIQPHRYVQAVADQGRDHNRTVVGLGHECPVALPGSWQRLDSNVLRVHKGKAKVSPSRFVTEVLATVGGEKVCLLATHTVSKPRRGVSAWAWRLRMYGKHKRWLRSRIAARRAQGWTCVWGGDMNKTKPGRFAPGQVQLIGRGYDHLWAAPSPGHALRAGARHSRKRTKCMDHSIVNGSFELS